jgi:predicted dithiol-disulfide oxidoreductase (DUF899 family)
MKNEVVSPEEWLEARKALLQKEKQLTSLRDELSAERRALPWERVQTDYVFQGPDGNVSLKDLFDGRSQLIIYHFMYGPDWDAGCKSCSFLADHAEPAIVHLNQRDVSFAVVSRAAIDVLEGYKQRMGWHFPWVSSLENSFNDDFHVSFSAEAVERGDVFYNYARRSFPVTEAPGASVFYLDESGAVFHTYSVFERGLDMFLTAYHYLDIVPKGRDEDGLSHPMEWIRRHDEY